MPHPNHADLRRHRDWAPVQSLTDPGGGWRVWSWEEPRLPGEIGWDTTLIANLGPVLRLAVADAAENVQADHSARLAARATHTVRGWLRTTHDPDEALAGAAHELHDPTRALRQRNPLATTAVVDINRRTGHAVALRAGDSEVWVKQGSGIWEPVFPGDMLTDEGRAAYQSALGSPEGIANGGGWAVQEVVLDDPAYWHTPAIGFEAIPRVECADMGVVDEVIVATDGARLTPERCDTLAHWLSHDIQTPVLSARPGDRSPHGDIGALWATRTTGNR